MAEQNVCISIGNSDDKLSQTRWSEFVSRVSYAVQQTGSYKGAQVHGEYWSSPTAPWQNACWWLQLPDDPPAIEALRIWLARLAAEFGQDSIAWLTGKPEFLRG